MWTATRTRCWTWILTVWAYPGAGGLPGEKSRARLVFASSRFVYGRIEYNPVDESHPFNCLSIYGIHKLAGEKYYRFYHEAYGLDTVSVRIANPYGPRQQMKHSKYGILNWFIRLALEGKPLTIYGDGRQRRDCGYVEDLAEAMAALAMTPAAAGQVYNLGSGMGTAFMKMAQAVAEAVPGTEVRQIEWPADRYFVETVITSAISPKSPGYRPGGPEPPFGKGLPAPCAFTGNTGSTIGKARLPASGGKNPGAAGMNGLRRPGLAQPADPLGLAAATPRHPG